MLSHLVEAEGTLVGEWAGDGSGVAASFAKRSVDVIAAGAGLLLLFPVLVLVALLVVVDSGWPAVFVQERVGLNGRTFKLWKFRTMVRDAHSLKSDLLALNEAPFPAFKLRRDPRVTRLGRVLRKTSLDELLQLVNVLKGEMSLVGPRPALPEEVAQYTPEYRARLAARPGITGPWQVTQRHRADMTFGEWVAMDVQYIRTWSLRSDFVLMVRTIPEVLRLGGH